MKKSRGVISLIVIVAVMIVLGVTAVCGIDLQGMGAARNINLGLDLEGGVSITYQVLSDIWTATVMRTIPSTQKGQAMNLQRRSRSCRRTVLLF